LQGNRRSSRLLARRNGAVFAGLPVFRFPNSNRRVAGLRRRVICADLLDEYGATAAAARGPGRRHGVPLTHGSGVFATLVAVCRRAVSMPMTQYSLFESPLNRQTAGRRGVYCLSSMSS
jgi:hypothetical protein